MSNLATIYNDKGNLGLAFRYASKILEAEPNHPNANYICGATSNIWGMHASAINYLKISVKSNPDNCDVLAELGKAHKYNSEYEKGISLIKQAKGYIRMSLTKGCTFYL